MATSVNVSILGTGGVSVWPSQLPPRLPFTLGAPVTGMYPHASVTANVFTPAPAMRVVGGSRSSTINPLVYTWVNGIAYVALPARSFVAFDTTKFLGIADNIAKALLDIQTAFVTNQQTTPPTLSTLQNGIQQLETRIVQLNNLSEEAVLASGALQSATQLLNFLSTQPVVVTQIYKDIFNELDLYAAGLAAYLQQNSLQVHPQFAQAFNYVAQYAPILLIRSVPLTQIAPQSVFIPTETTLGTITYSGVATLSYSAQPGIDTTQYGNAPLYLKNTGVASITSTPSLHLTIQQASGTQASFSVTLGTLAVGAMQSLNISGVKCLSVTAVSGGANGNALSVVGEPARTLSY